MHRGLHMSIDMIVRTISLILAPVVMITSCVLFLNGLLGRYEVITTRMRAMHHERLDILETLGESMTRNIAVGRVREGRVLEIETQLPALLHRHKLVRNAILAINGAILVFVGSMFVIALAVITSAPPLAGGALLVFLAATGLLLLGVIITTVELYRSQREVAYEIRHGMSLNLGQNDTVGSGDPLL